MARRACPISQARRPRLSSLLYKVLVEGVDERVIANLLAQLHNLIALPQADSSGQYLAQPSRSDTEGARFRCDHGLHLHRCGETVPAIELNADWSRPTAFAATSVEPEPQNGYSTTSPGRLNVSQMRWIDWLKSQGVQRTVRNRVRWDGEPDNQKPDPCGTGLFLRNGCRVHIAGRMVMSRTSLAAPVIVPISVALPVSISIV